MLPQHVAPESSCHMRFEALESQPARLGQVAYQLRGFRAKLEAGRTKATVTLRLRQTGSICPVDLVHAVRRYRCPNASNSSQWLALSSPLRPATTVVRKSLSLSTRNRFRSNRSTLANTSNTTPGLANWPVPTNPTHAASGVPS